MLLFFLCEELKTVLFTDSSLICLRVKNPLLPRFKISTWGKTDGEEVKNKIYDVLIRTVTIHNTSIPRTSAQHFDGPENRICVISVSLRTLSVFSYILL